MIDKNLIQSDKIKNIVFVSEGGIGKVITSTAIVKRLKEEFPTKRLIVITGYPDIFLHNPHVYRVFRFDNPLHFYDDYVTPESYVIKVEPYVVYEYLFNHEHLIDTWFKEIGIERKGAMPEMFFPENEIEAGRLYVEKITNKFAKDFVMFQWAGGIVPQEKSDTAFMDSQLRMHRRSLPKSVAQKVVNKLISRGFVVGIVQHENYPDLQGDGVVRINFPLRQSIILLKFSKGFIGIDSFLHHAAAMWAIAGVVCWGGTHPKKLGYEFHANIAKEVCPQPFCHRPDSYLFDMNSANGIWNCPYSQKCLDHDADEIIQEYEKVIEEKKNVG